MTVEPRQATLAGARLLAECGDYKSLVDALRARAAERRIAISSPSVHEVAGLPDRYLTKLLGPARSRSLGQISLGPVLAVLGIKLMIVEDPEQVARLEGRLTYVTVSTARRRAFGIKRTISFAHMRKIAKIGAKASHAARKARKLRSEKMRALAQKRWRLEKAQAAERAAGAPAAMRQAAEEHIAAP
jgi:hypothetical protein